MCFGEHCEHEVKTGPHVGECTCPPGQEKCPEPGPILEPIFQEIIDAHFPREKDTPF
jgi:hypothetical protein